MKNKKNYQVNSGNSASYSGNNSISKCYSRSNRKRSAGGNGNWKD